MCGIKASEAQWRGSTLRVCQALLKSAVLLSEIAKRLTFIFGNCMQKIKINCIANAKNKKRYALPMQELKKIALPMQKIKENCIANEKI